MSGPICPDCSMFDIVSFKNKDGNKNNRCTFCGWQGDLLPRKILPSHQMRSYRDEQRKMKKLKEKGDLIFIRIYVEDLEMFEDDLDVIEDLMDLLEIDSLDGSDNDPPYYFIMVNEKPSERTIKKITSLSGVTDLIIT